MVFNSRWPKHEVEVIGLDTWGHRLWLTKKQFKVYNCDPDAYAACELGFESAEQHREWLNVSGKAQCGGLTKSGTLCQASRGSQMSPKQWLAQHRKWRCSISMNEPLLAQCCATSTMLIASKLTASG